MRPNGVTQGVFGSLVTCSLLAAGRLDDAQALADEWAAVVEQYGNRPLHRATLHYNRSLIEMAVGLETNALDDAHVVLDLASRHDFQLMIIDALELIAELTSEHGNPVLATRLVGAADAERERIAYRARLRPQPHLAQRSNSSWRETTRRHLAKGDCSPSAKPSSSPNEPGASGRGRFTAGRA